MSTRTTIWATNDVIMANDLNALAGGWNSYTPQIDQGATTNIAKTVTYARYLQFGKLVIAQGSVTMSAAGTAGSAVRVSLPVTPDATAITASLPVGSGMVYDASASAAYSSLAAHSTGALVFSTGSTVGSVGAAPSFALAASDQIRWAVMYEAA